MKPINFTVPGEPKAKARPRMTKAGIAFTPKNTVYYENWVKECFFMTGQEKLSQNQYFAQIKAFFPIPKSYTKKKRKEIEAGTLKPTKKPDLDNIAKIILDSLNGIAYEDDKQIVELSISKHYSDDPRVEVHLSEFKT